MTRSSMSPTLSLLAESILLDCRAETLPGVFDAAAAALARQHQLQARDVRRALEAEAADSHFAVGAGIAVPHVVMNGLANRVVAVVRTVSPLHLQAIDREPVDLFFVVLYPAGDPSGHLQFLAHLASLCRSRLFRDGLRAATNPDEVIELVAAAETRLAGAARTGVTRQGSQALAIISVTGERAADSILVDLLGEDLGSASIFDARTVQDAASREVPLFAGFRDLFGDPGGRRVILAHVNLEQSDVIASIVQRACEDERSAVAELIVVPIANRWHWGAKQQAPRRSGH